MKITTRKLTETAIIIALATVLSMLKLFEMPYGGSVTPFSMIPVLIIVFRYEKSWGMITALLFAVVYAALSFAKISGWGLTWQALVGCLMLDYVIAYTCIGFAGFFRKPGGQVITGTVVAMVLRYICHVISGVVIFSSWMAPEIVDLVGSNIYIYSMAYNIFFFGPEALITIIGAMFIPRILRAVNRTTQ